MALKIQVEVFWIVTPRSVMIRYQRLRGPVFLRLHLEGVTSQKTSTKI